MPIYEYLCEDCGQSFEELIQSVKMLDRVTCPVCKSRYVKQQDPAFSTKNTRNPYASGAGSSSSKCGSSPRG